MKLSKLTNGFFGGLFVLTFSAPLFLHWVWLKSAEHRRTHASTQLTYYTSTFFVFPLALLFGVLGFLPAAAYFAYQCGRNDSLAPIIEILSDPYRNLDDASGLEARTSGGMLLGYSFALTLMSFTLVNILTGGFFGVLGTAGAVLASAIGASSHSFLQVGLSTLLFSYVSGLLGGALGYLTYSPPSPAPSNIPDNFHEYYDLHEEEEEQEENIENRRTVEQIPKLQGLLTQWKDYWQNSSQNSQSSSEMEILNQSRNDNDDQSQDEMIVISSTQPQQSSQGQQPLIQDDYVPTTQITTPGMNI